MVKNELDAQSEQLEVAEAAIAGAVEGIQAHLATQAEKVNRLGHSILRAIQVTLGEISTPISDMDQAIRDRVRQNQTPR